MTLAIRLGYLHLGANESLQSRVRSMRTVKEDILVGRGRILDRNERLLALDLPVKNIIVDPVTVLSNGQAKAVSAQLARVLGLPQAQVLDRVNRPGRRYEPVARLIREEEAAKVERLKLPGVFSEALTTRYYPQGKTGCHVLGFSNKEGVGSAGIEQRWNSYLKGRPGLRQSERDGQRREIYTLRSLEIAPQEGADIYLTLDQNIQYFVEKALDAAMTNYTAKAAWAIVEDVRTGEILAMASRPAYNLNEYNRTDAQTRLNRAVGVNYEPGSVFKVGVVAAALNEGLISTNDPFDCESGMWFYAGRPLRDYPSVRDPGCDGHPAQVQQHRCGEDRRDAGSGAPAPLSVRLWTGPAHGLGSARRGTRHPASGGPVGQGGYHPHCDGPQRRRDGAADAECAVLHRQRRVPDEEPSGSESGG